MNIKIMLGQLEGVNGTLNTLAKKRLDVYESFKVVKLAEVVAKELQVYVTTLDKLRRQYAKCDKDGELQPDNEGQLVFEGDNKELFLDEVQVLAQSSTNIEAPKLSLRKLAKHGVVLSPVELVALEPFLEIDIDM